MSKRFASAVSISAISLALGWAGSAAAQQASDVQELVVTASRVNAAGFTAPTPTTVLSAADVAKTSPIMISESLAQMPAFRTTVTSSSASVQANLRNVGATRTLVMVDGRRHVPTQSDGTMDLNMIPAALVQRTEVVTGGASASWGSDAVAGVINIILDNQLEGLRGSVAAGQSRYGDAQNYTASLAGGIKFAGDRAHVVFGTEYVTDKGIRDLGQPNLSRPWAYEERGMVSNGAFATNGLPGVLYVRGARRADNAAGGLITVGPLAGTTFDANGNPYRFGYGTVYSSSMVGGTDNFGESVVPGGDLRYPVERYSALLHGEFEVSDKLTAFGEVSYAHSLSKGWTNPTRFQSPVTGTATCTNNQSGVFGALTGAISININNPYIPAATRAAMVAANVTCINVGRVIREFPELRFNDGSPYVWRGVAGLKGDINDTWSWDAYYQYGENRSQQRRSVNINMIKFRYAIDAVTVNGQIVCRPLPATATDANRADFAGCVPVNIFGTKSITKANYDYFGGTSSIVNHTKQQVAALNLRGELFKTWAGPVSVATGVEYRKEELNAVADPISEATLWQGGNRKGSKGSYDVKEVYAEAVVPLAKDQAFADDLSLNGAVRYTDYSSSGKVTTWKVGATWDLGDWRLRGTRSRDIRAGNLAELFTALSTVGQTVRNSATGVSATAVILTQGNPSLSPEVAETSTGGVVYSPSFIDGLRMSVDYYKIKINGVIGTLTAQQTIDRCVLEKIQSACDLVTFDSSQVVRNVLTTQLNLNKYETSGLDVEVSYRSPIDRFLPGLPGNISARVLGNYVYKLATTAAVGGRVTDPAGQYNNPHAEVFTSLDYDYNRLNLGVEVRWLQGGTIDNTLTPGAISATGINIGHVGSTTYTYLNASYALNEAETLRVFARVNNLFDVHPPFPAIGGAAGLQTGGFDEVGRAYRVGLRFQY